MDSPPIPLCDVHTGDVQAKYSRSRLVGDLILGTGSAARNLGGHAVFLMRVVKNHLIRRVLERSAICAQDSCYEWESSAAIW